MPQPNAQTPEREDPLPLTLRFVLVLGSLILAGWAAMFFLLQARW